MKSMQNRLARIEKQTDTTTKETEVIVFGWAGADFDKVSKEPTLEEKKRGGVVFRWAD